MSVTYIENYSPPDFLIDKLELTFMLEPTKTIVKSKISLRKNPAIKNVQELKLDGEGLTLLDCKLNTADLAADKYTLLENSLIIDVTDALVNTEFLIEITNEINPQANLAFSGLYYADDIFCTQCEAQGFRRITYFLDRPDVCAHYTVRIEADKNKFPVLLANGNLIESGSINEERHFALWHDPFKKPSYLFALVAGDLVALEDNFITRSNRIVSLKIYVERQNCEYIAHAMQALKKSMLWDEQTYNREYDLDIYMIVAVNNFNMGAMENKGLNIFNSKYILGRVDSATDEDFFGIDLVVGHEYFHNWSGNRVTCRDWFQLSLKEGFTVYREQQFTHFLTESAVSRIIDVERLLSQQFAEDASPMAHAVQPRSYEQINNFYTATVYNKGAELIRMQHKLLGDAAYYAACDKYFSKFDGQAVTIDDFIQNLEQVSGYDLSSFKPWYTQAGTPRVKVIAEYDAKQQTYTLFLTQQINSKPLTSTVAVLMPLDIALFSMQGENLLPSTILEFTNEEQSFTFNNINKPPVLSFNRGFSAPILVELSQSLEELATLVKYDDDSFNRWHCLQKMYGISIKALYFKQPIDFALVLDVIAYLLTDNVTDMALIAHMLSLPTMSQLLQDYEQADILELDRIKLEFKDMLYQANKAGFLQLLTKLESVEVYAYSTPEVSRRKLLGVVLNYVCMDPDNASLAYDLFIKSNNMTDTYNALSALQHLDNVVKRQAYYAFYNKHKYNKLLLNKWLQLEVGARTSNLQYINELMEHWSFDINNPNSVYAFISGINLNVRVLHALDGSGYDLIKNLIIKLDAHNPQVAARAVTIFTKFKMYAPKYQKLIIARLQELDAIANKSSDISEIITKTLEAI